jgi:hypothetical protein
MQLIRITEGKSRNGQHRLRVHISARLMDCDGRRELAFAARHAAAHGGRYDLRQGRPNQGRFQLAEVPGMTLLRITVSFPARLVQNPVTHRMLKSATRAYRRLAPKGPALEPVPTDPARLAAHLIASEILRAGEGSDAPWAAAVSALQTRAAMLRSVADRLIQDGLAEPDHGRARARA